MTLRYEDLVALYRAADTNSLEVPEDYFERYLIGLVMRIDAATDALSYKLGSRPDRGRMVAAFIIAVSLSHDLPSNLPRRI